MPRCSLSVEMIHIGAKCLHLAPMCIIWGVLNVYIIVVIPKCINVHDKILVNIYLST